MAHEHAGKPTVLETSGRGLGNENVRPSPRPLPSALRRSLLVDEFVEMGAKPSAEVLDMEASFWAGCEIVAFSCAG